MKVFALAFVSFCAVAVCLAVQPNGSARRQTARSAAESEWHKEAKGFAATVVITPDPEWKAKCKASGTTVPRVDRTDTVRVGGKVWAVVLLSNPLPDKTGNVNVTCDLRLARPNGKVSVHPGLRALHGKLPGPATNTYVSEIGLTMTGEETDPLGEWVMELVVHDRNRGVDVPIIGRYMLLPKDSVR